MGRSRLRGAVFGAVALLLLVGCAGADEADVGESATSESSTDLSVEPASPTTETTVGSTTTTEPPPPDYEAIYRRLHKEAVAFLMDPLEQPSDVINCERNPGCVTVTNQALDGQFWRGMGEDNLTITSVEVLDEVSPNSIHLKVAAEAEDVIELVGPEGAVIESIGVPTGAVKRVSLTRLGDDWILSAPMDGRSWTRQAYEPGESFDLVDPLDEPMTPTGEEGTTEDGVSWRALVTDDRFCVEAEKLPIGKVTRCLSEPGFSDLDTTLNFRMVFSGDSPDQEYIGLWFGLKVNDGMVRFPDGREQVDQLFPVDSSAVFDADIELTVGVSAIVGRPETVWASGPEKVSDPITFDWPVPRD